MRYLRSNSRCSWVARALVALLLAPYLCLAARPAQAQRTTPVVYVLDFNNQTKAGGSLLGRVAAAQMSLQLMESPNWEVVPEAQVQRRIQDLGLKQPFDRPARVQIAAGVEATAAIYGKVLDARMTTGPTPQAFVRIQVVVEDIATTTLVNGATVEGVSTPRMGFTGDADLLFEEALGKAAFRAREFMDVFRLPEGTILNTTVVGTIENPELDALINIGARQGVRRGMEMVVTRLRLPVGVLRVTAVDSDVSTCRVTHNLQGVRPEDKARAMFNFRDFNTTRSDLRSTRNAAPAGVVPASQTGSQGKVKPAADLPRIARASRSEGAFQAFKAPVDAVVLIEDIAPPPPVTIDEPGVARAERGGVKRLLSGGTLKMAVGGLLVLGILAVGGRGGKDATRPYSLLSYGFQFAIGAPGAFIKVEWDRPKSLNTSDVLGYVIWRNDPINTQPLVVAGLDGDTVRKFLDNEQARTVTFYDAPPGSQETSPTRTTIAAVPGLTAGQEYRYQIQSAYVNNFEDRNRNGDPPAQGPDEILIEYVSPLSLSSGWTTAITPPVISGIDGNPPTVDQQVNLSSLAIEWQQTPGADSYTIWLSSEPTFRDPVEYGPFKTTPINFGGPVSVSKTLDVTSGKLTSARRVFITVGARNSQDEIRPKPFGAIFGLPVQVQPELPPPPPPDEASAAARRNGKSNGKGGNDRNRNRPGRDGAPGRNK